jgi:hypothetical protein
LGNPISANDPTGALSAAEFQNILDTLWDNKNSGFDGGGGGGNDEVGGVTWSSAGGFSNIYSSQIGYFRGGLGFYEQRNSYNGPETGAVTATFHSLAATQKDAIISQGQPLVPLDDKPLSSGALNGADLGIASLGALLDREEGSVEAMRKAGQWIARGKVYGSNFHGNQYVTKAIHVARFEKYLGTIKVLSKGLAAAGAVISIAQYANGDISGYRATANVVMGIVGTAFPVIGLGYDVLEATYGDNIEDMLWDGRPKD